MQKQSTVGRIHSFDTQKVTLDPWPIPKEQVISGNPEASGLSLWQSDDKRLANGIWTCTPGSFTWDYTWDDTMYFREGEVTITDQDGNTNTYRGGDMLYIPTGTRTKWEITQTIKKAFHIRSDTPVEL